METHELQGSLISQVFSKFTKLHLTIIRQTILTPTITPPAVTQQTQITPGWLSSKANTRKGQKDVKCDDIQHLTILQTLEGNKIDLVTSWM